MRGLEVPDLLRDQRDYRHQVQTEDVKDGITHQSPLDHSNSKCLQHVTLKTDAKDHQHWKCNNHNWSGQHMKSCNLVQVYEEAATRLR